MSEIVIAIIVGLVMLIGLIGAIIPGLPDIVLIWGASLGYGLLAGWGERGIWLFALITLIGLAGLFAEVWVSGTGAKIGGASIRAIFGGLALGLAGFIFSGPTPSCQNTSACKTRTKPRKRCSEWDWDVEHLWGLNCCSGWV